jgi:hypothetical protein
MIRLICAFPSLSSPLNGAVVMVTGTQPRWLRLGNKIGSKFILWAGALNSTNGCAPLPARIIQLRLLRSGVHFVLQVRPYNQQEPVVAPLNTKSMDNWCTSGSEYLNLTVLRKFEGCQIEAKVIKWLPQGQQDDEPALYKIKHEDGDIEDLEEEEVIEGNLLWKQHKQHEGAHVSDFALNVGAKSNTSGMCEICKVKHANYGVPGDVKRRRWCGQCGKRHSAQRTNY